MKTYVVIAILSYIAFAVNSVIDKFLLKKSIQDAATYAFYTGVLSMVALLLIPFGFAIPPLKIIFIALVSGACFVYALIAFYVSLKHQDASVVLPTMGAIVPVTSFILSYFLADERLTRLEIFGLALLVFGTVLLSGDHRLHKQGHWLPMALLGAVFFGMSFALAKVVYLNQSFISGLIWTRLGLGLGALTILLSPSARRKIFQTTRKMPRASGILFFAGQILAAGGGIMQNLAVSLGSVTIVNALQGTQFAFLFVLTWFLSSRYPRILQEDYSFSAIVRKSLAIIIIGTGLLLIA